MKKRGNLLAIMLATSMVFAGCANDNNKEDDKNEPAVEESKDKETTETTDEKEDTNDSKETTENKNSENNDDENTENVDKEDKKNDEKTADESSTEEGNVVLHRAYPATEGRSFPTIVVATSGDKIVDAFIDEYQFFDKNSEYKGVPNSDKEFGEGVKEGRILASKIDNEELYSEEMKEAGGEATLMDNYNAIIDYVKGKTIDELEDFISNNEDEEIIDALTGATFKSTPELLKYVVDTAKDDMFTISGTAENPDDITLKYAIGAPHGEKSFGNAVVALEGDKIIAASIDEYQYLEAGKTKLDVKSDFAKSYAKDNIVLGSKLENDEAYSTLMKDKAKATKSIKENFEAIENFVAGKTINEVKDVIADAKPGEAIEAVSGATLVDTAGYLQLIVDAAEK